MPVEVMKAFEDAFDCKILEGYGLSETSPVASFNHPDRERKPGSIGTPIEGVEMKVVDDDGNEVEQGEPGEIVIRGHNVMKGYWNRPDATAESIDDDGWFKTGDMATIDEDGYFFIVDRKKDLIIRGGYNVYPREIEEVIYEHPAVRECAVVGVPHDELGEEVGAAVALKEGEDVSADDLRAHCQGAGRRVQVPARRSGSSTSCPRGPRARSSSARSSHRRVGRWLRRAEPGGPALLIYGDSVRRRRCATRCRVAIMRSVPVREHRRAAARDGQHARARRGSRRRCRTPSSTTSTTSGSPSCARAGSALRRDRARARQPRGGGDGRARGGRRPASCRSRSPTGCAPTGSSSTPDADGVRARRRVEARLASSTGSAPPSAPPRRAWPRRPSCSRRAEIDGDWLAVDGEPLTAEHVRAALREACAAHGAPRLPT